MTEPYGRLVDGGTQFRIKLDSLIDSRMLIQANSGGGKSYAVRKLLEMTHGGVQQIVIDPEGEFATLRENFDYVICAAQGGDALAHPKTAKLLAERLLETGVSAIVDIYELKPHERASFVRIFLDAMVNAPKHLWHPCLVVLDEAHVYAPESDKSEAHGAVADIATRGRKRGFCLVAATQRISKLSKDVAAELNNKLIGRATLDVDVKRAAAELGIPVNEALKLLRNLDPGQFYGFGPATNVVAPTLMKVGEVVTRHPKRGERATAAPKPTKAILDVLPKLSDLPKEAEQELRTTEDLRKELTKVRRELTLAQRAQPTAATAPATPSTARQDAATIKRLRNAVEALMKFIVTVNTKDFAADGPVDPQQIQKAVDAAVTQAMKLIENKFAARTKDMDSLRLEGQRIAERVKRLLAEDEIAIDVTVQHNEPFTVKSTPAAREPRAALRPSAGSSGGIALPPGERATLGACIQYPDGLERSQLTVLTGYKRSSRDAYIQRLREKGFVTTDGDKVAATAEGIASLPDFEPLPRGQDLIDFWMRKLPEGEKKVLQYLIDANGQSVDRASIDESTGYQRSSRDAYLQRLRAKQLVIDEGRGQVKASAELFA